MVDSISKDKRSWNMSRIRSKNTKPELIVRSMLHQMGYRFRLHGKVAKKYYSKGVLPGKPDIVLVKSKTVIFVHGCFWHRHENCKEATVPKTKTDWWITKLNKNVERDKLNRSKLKEMGWEPLIVWECQIKKSNISELKRKLKEELTIE
jgi:DNA mismatch endonuclease, patch repair protein